MLRAVFEWGMTVKKMKLAGLVAGALLISASAQAQLGLGMQVGDRAGLSVGYQDLQFGFGLDTLSMSVDKTFSFSQYPALYYGVGAIITERESETLGARAVFGARHRIDQIEFFGNLAPTMYIVDNTDVKLEANVGFRFYF